MGIGPKSVGSIIVGLFPPPSFWLVPLPPLPPSGLKFSRASSILPVEGKAGGVDWCTWFVTDCVVLGAFALLDWPAAVDTVDSAGSGAAGAAAAEVGGFNIPEIMLITCGLVAKLANALISGAGSAAAEVDDAGAELDGFNKLEIMPIICGFEAKLANELISGAGSDVAAADAELDGLNMLEIMPITCGFEAKLANKLISKAGSSASTGRLNIINNPMRLAVTSRASGLCCCMKVLFFANKYMLKL